MATYFISDGQKQSGPHVPQKLRDLWTSGEVNDDALVRGTEADEWRPLIEMMPPPGSDEANFRKRNLRLRNAIGLIETISLDVDYVDLEPMQRRDFAELYAEICAKPLDEWSSMEKTIYKFWRDLEPYRYAESGSAEIQHGIDAQLSKLNRSVELLSKEIQAVREENAKTKWAARSAALAIWLIIIFGMKFIVK